MCLWLHRQAQEKSDVSHRSICIGFLQTWRTRSCRHSLPRYFPFGLTNERSSVDPSRERGQSRCLGPRNFRDRKQRSFRAISFPESTFPLSSGTGNTRWSRGTKILGTRLASEGKYNLVFTSPEALFGSHRSSILALKSKIQAVFIDEVHCVAKWLVFF